MALERQIELAISEAILSETLRILRDKFHRTPEQLEDTDRFIQSITRHVYPTERLDAVPTDRDDNRVLECALKAGSDAIVSGDTDLLRLGTFQGIEILRVTDFLQRSPQ
jgi:uncharacterized protein